MTQTLAISKTILTMAALQQRFGVVASQEQQFFAEWAENLPELLSAEIATLDQIKARFERHRNRDTLAEGTINQLLISPLFTLAGLYDEPFFISTEPSLEIELKDQDEVLRGRIDTLIIQQQFWVLVVESKSTIAFSTALQQAMAYMMANPNPVCPVYGLITNGDEFMFIKMLTQGVPQYDLSNVFSLLIPRRNQLYDIFQILKQIRQIMLKPQCDRSLSS
ncbi:MAG: type I restriction endonuclease subunit R [Leptolyngbyaceae cyanobacterium SM1_1_3]|nr:type I restriction endonuclease subunit R [Leptolyngbyaceae cyanobacterium SM1_1_3]NJN03472.1 type I restriction endonuclease subunit R [Leptolyngbyaceae cyanobacterium RM1_1_2]NJO09503.1 type I restriction endonuclease subunit R [Leptolyngbyaceae cyanobacterium SL_1_1]